MPPQVEFLYWEGCPSHTRALDELREALGEVGLDPGAIEVREVLTDEQAERANFRGSPTILVDGRDVDDASGEPVALACRVYRRRDGRPSPVPDPDDLRDALRDALEGAAR
jgi:hypothetical protein